MNQGQGGRPGHGELLHGVPRVRHRPFCPAASISSASYTCARRPADRQGHVERAAGFRRFAASAMGTPTGSATPRSWIGGHRRLRRSQALRRHRAAKPRLKQERRLNCGSRCSTPLTSWAARRDVHRAAEARQPQSGPRSQRGALAERTKHLASRSDRAVARNRRAKISTAPGAACRDPAITFGAAGVHGAPVAMNAATDGARASPPAPCRRLRAAPCRPQVGHAPEST